MRKSQTAQDDTAGETIRSFFSLTQRQAASISAIVLNGSTDWVLDHHQTCDGHLMLLITPAKGGDDTPTYTVDRDAAGLHLRVLEHETYRALDTFSALHDLVAVLQQIVTPVVNGGEVICAPEAVLA
jgi:hypothetical protein